MIELGRCMDRNSVLITTALIWDIFGLIFRQWEDVETFHLYLSQWCKHRYFLIELVHRFDMSMYIQEYDVNIWQKFNEHAFIFQTILENVRQ